MNARLDIKQQEPEAYSIMLNFEKYLGKIELTQTHKNLIKIRASQLNGCSYCIDMHTKEARAAGETDQRIYVLSSWRDTPFFTEKERAILAATEEVTFIQHRLSEATYTQAVNALGEKYLAQVMMAVIVINAWNRIGIATEMMPA
ncbi:MAG TPA: carboxymuconolactone decarboxylase family protein [Chryseolinea sp.]|nr:carboxymuconolactone decarboxylase family protein [Chryseolinea sp.]HPM32906.1 carboxymuconolactone decarboxylase family protein [Chryseolinea sp.]